MSYSTDDLMSRYNVSRPGLLKFVHSHIEEIGAEHAKKIGKEWVFDSEAVKIIDDLKNRGITVVDNAWQADRIMELERESGAKDKTIIALQNQLMVMQGKQEKVVLLEQTTQRAEKAEAEVKELHSQIKAEAEEKGKLKATVQAKDEQITTLKEFSEKQLAEKDNQIDELRQSSEKQLAEKDNQLAAMQQELLASQNANAKWQAEHDAEKGKSLWQKFRDILK